MLTVMFIDEELLIKSKYKKGKEGCWKFKSQVMDLLSSLLEKENLLSSLNFQHL